MIIKMHSLIRRILNSRNTIPILMLFVSLFVAWQTKRTADSTIEVNKLTIRPYIFVTPEGNDNLINGHEDSTTIYFSMVNCGKLPANDIDITIELFKNGKLADPPKENKSITSLAPDEKKYIYYILYTKDLLRATENSLDFKLYFIVKVYYKGLEKKPKYPYSFYAKIIIENSGNRIKFSSSENRIE